MSLRHPRFLFLALLLFLSSVVSNAQLPLRVIDRSPKGAASKYVEGELLVKYRAGIGEARKSAITRASGSLVRKQFGAVNGLQLIAVPAGQSVLQTAQQYRQSPEVEYAEPNYVVHLTSTPNDPSFPTQWHLQNTLQFSGIAGADIGAVKAWDITQGSSDVVIAVLDTGIDYNHPDLAPNLFRNVADCNSNGIDDDGNGYVDDCSGINVIKHVLAIDDTSDPMDDVGHGTHVAGIIGAVGNNGLGVSGVNWNVRLLPCKFIDQTGYGTIAGAIECLSYVKALKDRGVNIVATNNSWGVPDFSLALADAVNAQMQSGILFIAAAGNDFDNNDVIPVYPANLSLSNVITVAATDRFDGLAAFSNFSRFSVHLGAPGEEILSTLPGASYGLDTGTSMAAPMVAGVAGLLKAQDPSRDWRAIKNLLLAGGDSNLNLANATVSGRRLNAFGSLSCSNSSVLARTLPVGGVVSAAVNSPMKIAVVNTNCGVPAGVVQATVQQTGQTINLKDDGVAPDDTAGDGIYTGQFIAPATGNYTVSIPGTESFAVDVLTNYTAVDEALAYRNIGGTSLDLSDDAVAVLASPFPIHFGGGSFQQLYVSSNGTVSFTNAFGDYFNRYLPQYWDFLGPGSDRTAATIVAPFWDDLLPVKGTSHNVFWDVTGTAPNRELILEWRDVPFFDCGSNSTATVSFELVFTEGHSDFRSEYGNFNPGCSGHDLGASATVGEQVDVQAGNTPFAFALRQPNTAIHWFLITDPAGPPNPAPVLSSISPTSVAQNSYVDLFLFGANFNVASEVHVQGQALVTRFVNDGFLRATIPPSMLANAGTLAVQVVNPAPGGGASAIMNLTVTADSVPPPMNGAFVQNFGPGQGQPIIKPQRFLGWRYGINNAEYLKAFSTRKYAPATSESAPEISGSAPAVFSSGTRIPAPELHHSMPAGFLPSSVAVGDFNGDGHQDWAVANGGDDTVWLYFGKGDGTAAPPSIIHLNGSAPIAIAAADLRGSGKLDLMVAEADSLSVEVLLGRGDGTFGKGGLQFVPGIPTAIAVADFNADGHPDVLVSMFSLPGEGPVALLSGDGTGRLGDPVVPPLIENFEDISAYAMTVADFNNDGLPDVILERGIWDPYFGFSPEGTFLYVNRGNGVFKQQGQALPDFFVFAAGDMNHDGCADFVGLNGYLAVASPYLGHCDGTFTPSSDFPLADLSLTMALADVNGDGNLDLLSTGFEFELGPAYGLESGSLLSVSLGDGTGNFGQPSAYRGGLSAFGFALVDLNGDGRPDVVTADQDADTSTQFLNDGKGGFGLPSGGYIGYIGADSQGGAINAPLSNAMTIDLNGDGKIDLAWMTNRGFQGSANDLTVVLNKGDGTFSAPVRTPISPQLSYSGTSIVFGDFRGMGRNDMVVTYSNPGTTQPYVFGASNNDGKFTMQAPVLTAIPSFSGFTNTAAGDLDGDGKLDFVIAYACPSGICLSVFKGNGDGTFAEQTAIGIPVGQPASNFIENPEELTVADLNHDGKLDVLFHTGDDLIGNAAQNVYELLGNGDGTFQPVRQVLSNLTEVAILDVNHDGNLDVIEQGSFIDTYPSFATARYTVYLGQPDGTFVKKQELSAGLTGLLTGTIGRGFVQSSVIHPSWIGDFDGDGNIDLAVIQSTQAFPRHSYVQFAKGNGDGTFSPMLRGFNLGGLAVPSVSADLNGDGRTDFIETDGLTSIYQVILTTFTGNLFGTFSPQPIIGDTGRLTIALAAPVATDTAVNVSTGDANIVIPATVNIPGNEGNTVATVQIAPSFSRDRVLAATLQSSTETTVALGYAAPPGSPAGVRVFTDASRWTTTVGVSTPDYVVHILSVQGFTAQLTPKCEGLPAGLSCQFGSDGIALGPGGALLMQMIVVPSLTVAQGKYPFKLVLTDGINSFEVPLTVGIGDFSVRVTSPVVTALSTSYTTVSLNIDSTNGFSGLVALSCSGLPASAECSGIYTSAGLPASINVITHSTAPGNYPFTIIAANQTLQRSGSVTLRVQGLSGSFRTPSATVKVGSTVGLTLDVTAPNGFDDPITLQCVTPAAVSCALSQTTVVMTGSATTASIAVSVTANSLPAGALIHDSLPRRWTAMIWIGVLPVGILFGAGRIRRRTRVVASLLMLVVAVGATSCGGGGGGGTSNNPPVPPGPPAPQSKTVIVEVVGQSRLLGSQILGVASVTVTQ